MDPVTQAALASWRVDPWLAVSLAAAALLYGRGWLRLHQQMPRRFGARKIACFYAGLAAAFLAVASPLDAFASLLLQAHMAQHLLLTMVAPPLLLAGAPVLPLLRGLPRSWFREGAAPLLAAPEVQWLGRTLTHPAFCWLAFSAAMLLWHIPAPYELALRSRPWHVVEHACFFGTALLFWWPVVQPWPSRPRWSRWSTVAYLVLADLQNTALSAFLVFCDRVVYPTYAAAPRFGALSALEDQAAAGALMWVPGSIAFLLPAGAIVLGALGAGRGVRPSAVHAPPARRALRVLPARRPGAFDLLRAPVVGRVLGWRHFRRVAQSLTFGLAAAVVADGLLGPEASPMNLAGVLPWTHWRGLAVVGLLAAGNVFCMACPFMLTRDLGRRWLPARWRWPSWLRSKWLAVGLLALYLWAYEAFSLWDSPRWTAWVVVGYFVAALVVDGLFAGASFCKYVCPIGQFHFLGSTVSPLEVKVRDAKVCGSCAGHECIRGNGAQRGCELRLFQPNKVGNLDCTFCLDCVHACPNDNVGLLAVAPGAALADGRRRSSLGRLARRPDLAALALVLAFGAFANAAAMVAPVAAWGHAAALVVLGAVVLPPLVAAACGAVGRAAGGVGAPWREVTCDFAFGLVPLGFGMWLAHLSFHLASGFGSAIPVLERFARDVGLGAVGEPNWSACMCGPTAGWLLGLEILALDAGLLLTLYVIWRTASRYTDAVPRALGLAAPWSLVAVALYAAGIWIVFQPMQMRGMMMAMQ